MNFVQVRYQYDNPAEHGLGSEGLNMHPGSAQARTKLLAEAIRITPALFPSLADHFQGLRTSMLLDEEVDCFVLAEPGIQAFCVTHMQGHENRYSVVLSSGLIERLEPEEIRFVIGHEVGHFLCGHWRYPSPEQDSGLGHRIAALQLSRAAEISADRIGMMACRSLDSACAAMIKVAAGCGSPHLIPDIPSLLQQFRQLSKENGLEAGIWMTHPIIPLRIRALLHFEPAYRLIVREAENWPIELQAVDKAVEADFQRSTGQALKKLADLSLESVRCWGLVYLFCAHGVISKAEQRLLDEALGTERAFKVLKFLRNQQGSPGPAVRQKLADAASEAQRCPLARRKDLISEFETLLGEAGILDAAIVAAMDELRAMLLLTPAT